MPEIPAEQPPGRGEGWRVVMLAVLETIPLVGKPLAVIIKGGAWQPLAWLALAAWVLLVYPLMVPAIAGWLLNQGVLGSWHQAYADNVRRAFKVEELADSIALRGNRRLDYYQSMEAVRSANTPQSFSFSVQRNQQVILRKEDLGLRSDNGTRCPVPLELAKPGVPVFEVKVGTTQVGTLLYGPTPDVIAFNGEKWNKLRDEAIDGRLIVRLDPVPRLMEMTCTELLAPLRFTIEVYKDLVALPGAAASASGS